MQDGHGVSSRTIVGRDDQLKALDSVLAAAVEGSPRMLVLAGEAGVGKTRLAAELETRARERGMLVLHGETVELGGDELPYAPVMAALRGIPQDQLLDALAELDDEARLELAALLPRVRVERAAPDARRLWDGYGQGRLRELLLDLLGRLAREHAPLLMVLEDVHWADRSSRDLVAFLARNLTDERVAVALTFRTGELPAAHPLRRLMTELVRRPVVVRLDLEPLGRGDVARQLEAIAGRPVPASVADDLHARSGGNPFFVEELFAAGSGHDVPPTLAETVATRADAMAPAGRALLETVAAAGGRIGHEPLQRVMPGAELGPALREAVDAGLLVRDTDDGGVSLRHGLLGEVIYGALVPAERTALHRALAAALAETGASAAELAAQWQRAGEPGPALRASVEAGISAAHVYAFAEARGHLERALSLWEATDPGELPADRVEILSLAAQAARFSGDRERAVALGREALERDDGTVEVRTARLYERLGEYQSWDDAAALECYERALAALPDSPSPERARLLAAEGHALMGLRRWEEARARCEAALEAGDEAHAVAAGLTLGLVLGFLGEPDEGERHLRLALETAERLGAAEETARAYVHLGELLRLRGDHAGALEAMLTGERTATRLGMRGSFGQFMFVNAADDLLRLGRWDEAARRLEDAERMDLGVTAAAMHRATAGHLHALRGETEGARAQLEAGLELIAQGLPAEFATPARTAWAALALGEGDPAAARGHVEAAVAAGGRQDPLYTPALLSIGARAEADLAERGRALRRDADVAEAVGRADDLLADFERLPAGAVVPDALAHRALARAERARLDGGEDPELWAAAAAAWEELAEPYPAAYARLHQAEALLAASGDRRAAAAVVAPAHATADSLGAAPLREALEALARRARLDVPAAPDEPPPGPADELALTRRETDVLALLAEGLTNREIATRLFISEKTVGTHVAHIFEKLGVHGRVEAAGRAHALGVLDRSR